MSIYDTSCVTHHVSHNHVSMICQWCVISCNKLTTVVGDVDCGWGHAFQGTGGMWKISVHSSQICCESQTKKSLCAKLLQLYPKTLCDPTGCSLAGSSVCGILQARIHGKWVAMPFSRRSSQPRDWTCFSYVPCIGRQVLSHLQHLRSPSILEWILFVSMALNTAIVLKSLKYMSVFWDSGSIL